MFFMGINSVENTKIAIDISFINGVPGLFQAMPYVLWFFVGIDVVMLTAEEIRSPGSSVTKSFYSGLLTIIVLSFGVIFFSVSSVYWPSLKGTDYPLIFVLQRLQGDDAVLLAVFSFFSISSFVASLNGMMIGYSRQAFSLARAGYFPKFMDRIHHKTKAPFMALIAPSILAIVFAEVGNAASLIQIVCICAIISYSLSLLAFIKITRVDGGTYFKTIPAFIALFACAVFLIGFLLFQTVPILITAGISTLGILYYFVFAKGRINRDAPEEVEANLGDINIIITNL
jgi:ethanolamine permease